MSAELRVARSWHWLAGGIVIGGLAAGLIFASTDMQDVLAILAGDIDYLAVGGALLAYGLFFLGKALRWHYLLRPLIEVSAFRLLAYVLIGYAGNVVLPMQAGEVARGVMTARHHEVKLAAVLAGIALEKALDFLCLLLFLTWALWTVETSSPLAEHAALVLAAVLSLVALALFAALMRPEATGALIDRAMDGCPATISLRLRPRLHEGLSGLAALRRGTLLVKILAAGLATWGCMLVALCLVLGSVQVEVSVAGAAIVLVLAAIGLALPTSPGFVGTLQAAFVFGLVPLGVTQEAAVAASLLYQALTTVPPVAAAVLCWAGLRRQRRAVG